MKNDQALLTTQAFSKLSGLSVSAVTKRLRNGTIQGQKVSGRWRIPKDQLSALQSDATAAGVCSVTDFAARTYLTEAGVKKWLSAGRLTGRRDTQGNWQVDLANLDRPEIGHLVRR